MNDLILERLKEIKQLKNDIKLNELDYETKSRKKIQLHLTFIASYINRNIHTEVLLIEDADRVLKKLSDINKDKKNC